MSGPLAGLKVLELGTLIAGPFAARMFAEFGAEVLQDALAEVRHDRLHRTDHVRQEAPGIAVPLVQ